MKLKPANIRTPAMLRGAYIETVENLSPFLRRANRIDAYRNMDGTAQLGIAWADGSTFITDVDSWASLTVWVAQQIDAGVIRAREVKQHFAGRQE